MMRLSLITRPTRGNGRRGFVPILIAVGIVSLLGVMSLTDALSMRLLNRKIIERINRAEGFYSGELLAWHAYQRSLSGLEVSGASVAFDNRYSENLAGEGGEILPYNIIETRKYSPTPGLIRRYVPERFIATKSASAQCGRVGFQGSNKNYRVCLSSGQGTTSKLYLSLTSAGPGGKLNIIRILSNGKRDPSFGNSGLVSLANPFSNMGSPDSTSITRRSDQKLLLSYMEGFQLLNPDGQIDGNFGSQGLLAINHKGDISKANLGSDSSLVTNDVTKIYRYLSSGSPDPYFGSGGSLQLSDFQIYGLPNRIFQTASHVWFTGRAETIEQGVNIVFKTAIFKLDKKGQPDNSFGLNGRALSPDRPIVRAMLSTSAQEVFAILSLKPETSIFVAKYLANGTPDITFGTHGVVDLGLFPETYPHCHFESESSFLIGARKLTYSLLGPIEREALTLTRYNINGTTDTHFGENGSVTIYDRVPPTLWMMTRVPSEVGHIDSAADRSIFVSTSVPGQTGNAEVYKFLGNGSVDTKFGEGGKADFLFPGGSFPITKPRIEIIN